MSAKDIEKALVDSKKINLCHFLVDDEEIINIFPTSKEASHTGKGYDFGNRYTIAVEICKSQCDLDVYMLAQNKAIELIKELMSKHNLTENDIYFHQDFNNVYCPHRILEIYKTKERFLNECFVQN